MSRLIHGKAQKSGRDSSISKGKIREEMEEDGSPVEGGYVNQPPGRGEAAIMAGMMSMEKDQSTKGKTRVISVRAIHDWRHWVMMKSKVSQMTS